MAHRRMIAGPGFLRNYGRNNNSPATGSAPLAGKAGALSRAVEGAVAYGRFLARQAKLLAFAIMASKHSVESLTATARIAALQRCSDASVTRMSRVSWRTVP